MPPDSNEIDKAYYFAFIHLYVCLSVCHAFLCMPYLKTLHARVLKFYIWVPHGKIADVYIFSCPACLFFMFFFFFF